MLLRALIIYTPSRIHACVFLKWAPAQFNGEQWNSCFMSSNKTSNVWCVQAARRAYHVVPGVPPSYLSVILCRVCLFAFVYELLDWMRHQLVDIFGFNVFLRDSTVVYFFCGRTFSFSLAICYWTAERKEKKEKKRAILKYQIRVYRYYRDSPKLKKCIQLGRIERLCIFREAKSGSKKLQTS